MRQTVPLDDALGRRAGVLLGRARHDDVIDAAVGLLAGEGHWIPTSGAKFAAFCNSERQK